jgi:glycosyltransferase involved in cell wall biosynthesis
MSNELPLVCICIPTYNAAATIKETLESILAQTYNNIVIHVSDNASSDETLMIVESIANRRVKIHRHAENVGGEENFNRCIRLAEGKYTAIFHADDIYEQDMVAKQVAFLEAHPEAAAVFTEASTIDEMGKRIGQIHLPKGIEPKDGLYDFKTMFKAVLRYSNFFICPSAMVRTQVYQQEVKSWLGERFKTSSDLDVWLRILLNHPIGYLKEKLMRYRISSHQWSAKVRRGTERGDFFLVTDYYLAQEYVQSFLTATDISNYKNLDRRDRVKRAVNLYITGFPIQANKLIPDVFSLAAIKSALKSKQGVFVLFVGSYLKLLVLLRLNKIGKSSLLYMKNVIRK